MKKKQEIKKVVISILIFVTVGLGYFYIIYNPVKVLDIQKDRDKLTALLLTEEKLNQWNKVIFFDFSLNKTAVEKIKTKYQGNCEVSISWCGSDPTTIVFIKNLRPQEVIGFVKEAKKG